MNHESNVRFVYAHTKSNSGAHNLHFVLDPLLLSPRSLISAKS